MMRRAKLYKDQSGMAAIVITTVLMLVITVITLGFAQTVRREQRNALDHQLATQAYYAAESGVNLAESKMKQIVQAGGTVPNKDACAAPASGTYGSVPFVDAEYEINSNSRITCLLIQSELPNQEFQNINNHAAVSLLKAKSGSIDELEISWQASTRATDLSNCSGTSFPPQTGTVSPLWRCSQPLLRIDLVPLAGSLNALDRNTVMSGQFTAFLYPGSSAGTVGYSPGALTNQVLANCNTANTPKICKVTINNLAASTYGIRVMSMYGRADITLTPTSAGTPVTLVDGQVMVDVTARSADVLRRVQVRTSVAGTAPDFELTSGGSGICKRYLISAGVLSWTAGSDACSAEPTIP